jgi:hypothetical protein
LDGDSIRRRQPGVKTPVSLVDRWEKGEVIEDERALEEDYIELKKTTEALP